ncbi:MAG: hypothetical protein R3C14_36680 [Caldilineaceae bacterium]
MAHYPPTTVMSPFIPRQMFHRRRTLAHTCVWHGAQIREGARLGQECIVGKNVYIDFEVVIGNRVKIQNNALLYHGVTLEVGVFIGPQACLTTTVGPAPLHQPAPSFCPTWSLVVSPWWPPAP